MIATGGSRDGQVVTFYSYKGGVGRTMALANVAVQLAWWGYTILCIDWDLEAPGLHLYFANWLEKPPERGLVDLIIAAAADQRPQWRDYVIPLRRPHESPNGGIDTLHLLAAGATDSGYVTKLQGLDWPALYDRHNLGTFIEQMRAEWKNAYDYILIDSRTGLTDIGGICTVQLPDVLVLLFTASHQSLDGIKSVAVRATERRNALPVERARLLCVPVPSRFDTRVEYTISKEWLARFASDLRPLYEEWLHKEVTVEEVLAQLRLPYVPYWSYGEPLLVLEESGRDPENLSYALETLSAVIAHRIEHSDLLARSRDSFVSLAVLPSPQGDGQTTSQFVYDLYVSAGPSDAQFSTALAAELRRLGWRVFASTNAAVPSEGSGTSAREEALRHSRHLILALGRQTSTVQHYEATEFLKTSLLDPAVERRIVPVQTGPVETQATPTFLHDIHWLDARLKGPTDIALEIDMRLGGAAKRVAIPADRLVISTGSTISPPGSVLFDDPHETHGDFVSTRGHHTLELPYDFRLAPLLVTNAVFAQFVQAGGYNEDVFWPSVSRGLRRRFVCLAGRSLGPSTWHSAQEFLAGRENHPVAGICYYEAVAFVNWLNRSQSDARWLWRLPAEDMWELAARGLDGLVYPWGNDFKPDACNSVEQQIGSTTPVGQYPEGSGPYGNLDLAGNVWEFVEAGDQPPWACVLRGGSFVNDREEVKSTLRLFSVPREHRPPDFGFRCAQEPRDAPA